MGTDIRTGVAFTTTGLAGVEKQHQWMCVSHSKSPLQPFRLSHVHKTEVLNAVTHGMQHLRLKNTLVNRHLAQECVHTIHSNGLKKQPGSRPPLDTGFPLHPFSLWNLLFHHSSGKHGQKPAKTSGTSKAIYMEGSSCYRSFGNMLVGCPAFTLLIQRRWERPWTSHKSGKLGKSNPKCSQDSGPTMEQFDTKEHFHIQIRGSSRI